MPDSSKTRERVARCSEQSACDAEMIARSRELLAQVEALLRLRK